MNKTMITGITPSGKMTLGNYLGVVKRLIEFQEKYNLFVFVANLHAITLPQDPKTLKNHTYEIAALYLSAGLNSNKTTIFIQSEISEHSQLAWILNSQTYMGELSRMTQFKDKSQKLETQSSIPAGLFNYPSLMAADILLYNSDFVPVGIDQKQHVEMTRNLATRINNKYGEIFKIPEPLLTENLIKIMDLQEPTKKMSKSSTNEKAIIYILDDEKMIAKKIASALTDSENLIKYDPIKKPGVSNLMNIYCMLTNTKMSEAEKRWTNKNYKNLKDDVTEAIIKTLKPIQEKYYQLINSDVLKKVLMQGRNNAKKIAQETLEKVHEVLGIC